MSSWRWDRTASVHAFSEVSPAGRRSFRHVQTQLLTSRTQMLFAFPERMSNYARTHQATKSQVQIYHRRRNVLACIWRREADLMFLSLLAEYICIVLTLLLQIPYNIYIGIFVLCLCAFDICLHRRHQKWPLKICLKLQCLRLNTFPRKSGKSETPLILHLAKASRLRERPKSWGWDAGRHQWCPFP